MIDLNILVTQAEFGAIVGITRQAVGDLMSRNVISADQTAEEMVFAYCRHLREVGASRGADSDLAFQRSELARVSRERNEIQLARERKEFANVELLELVCSHIGQSIASHLEALPDAIACLCPALTDDDLKRISTTIAKAQEIAANARLIDFETADSDDPLAAPTTELEDL